MHCLQEIDIETQNEKVENDTPIKWQPEKIRYRHTYI